MKNWYIIDDCTSTKSEIYTERLNAETSADAMNIATSEWESLSHCDQMKRNDFYVGYADEDADGCVDYDTMTEIIYIIRDRKPVCYVYRDFDDYGNLAPVCVTATGASDLAYDPTNPDKVEFTDIWREATRTEIAEYGISED